MPDETNAAETLVDLGLQIEPAIRNDTEAGWREIIRLRRALEAAVRQRNSAEEALTRVDTERLRAIKLLKRAVATRIDDQWLRDTADFLG